MKRFITLLLASALLVSAAAGQSTIFIVRHAEKGAGGGFSSRMTTKRLS
jgi:hypothetical protein